MIKYKCLAANTFIVANDASYRLLIKEHWKDKFMEGIDGTIPDPSVFPVIVELAGYPGTGFDPFVYLTSVQDYIDRYQRKIDAVTKFTSE